MVRFFFPTINRHSVNVHSCYVWWRWRVSTVYQTNTPFVCVEPMSCWDNRCFQPSKNWEKLVQNQSCYKLVEKLWCCTNVPPFFFSSKHRWSQFVATKPEFLSEKYRLHHQNLRKTCRNMCFSFLRLTSITRTSSSSCLFKLSSVLYTRISPFFSI